MSKPKIIIIGTGGTISSMADDSLEVLDYPETSRKIEPREAIQRVHEAARFAELLPLSFRAVGSAGIAPQDWIDLARLIATVFGSIADAAQNGEEVSIFGFGRFQVTERGARKGRNPYTGEAIKIAASKRLKFSPARAMKAALNSKRRARKKA